MAPRSQNWFTKFVNSPWWKVFTFVMATIYAVAIFILVNNQIPDQIKDLVKNINETHSNVACLTDNLKDKIEGGQDVSVGISSRASDGQAILLKNSNLHYVEGQSIVLHNPGSNFKPRIKLLITAVEEPTTTAEREGKIQIYINTRAVSMLDYNPKHGTKKLKIMELQNGTK